MAIGNPNVRLSLIHRIESETSCKIATLISPRAYVSPFAQIRKVSVIEPMAVVHTDCVLGVGCLVSAGAVINHASVCEMGVHADCNSTVLGNRLVPEKARFVAESCSTENKFQLHRFPLAEKYITLMK